MKVNVLGDVTGKKEELLLTPMVTRLLFPIYLLVKSVTFVAKENLFSACTGAPCFSTAVTPYSSGYAQFVAFKIQYSRVQFCALLSNGPRRKVRSPFSIDK